MKGVLALVAAAGSVAASDAPHSGVSKVISMLKKLKDVVAKDIKSEGESFDAYAEYCDDEGTQRQFAIKDGKKAIAQFSAIIESTKGAIVELNGEIEGAASDAAKKGAELAEATSVRKSEREDFVAAEKELVDTVDALSRAITIIKRSMSFVQGSAGMKDLSKQFSGLTQALGAIISASNLDDSRKSQVSALLEEDDLSLLAQPQATVANYDNHSGGIVSTLEDMKDMASSSLQTLRREEVKARHAFELIKQSLQDATANLNAQIKEDTANKNANEEKLAKAEADLAATEASKDADEKFLGNLKSECANKAAEWSERQATASNETAALSKATEILSGKFDSLAQVSVKKTSLKALAAVKDTRDELTHMLRKMGRRFNSYGLMQLAGLSQSDPFVKIRGLIENMISKLEKQAQEEATQEAFCQEETAKSAAKRAKTQKSVDKYQARIDSANAAVAQLTSEVSTLRGEIADIVKSVADATKLRANEKSEFQTAQKDFQESISAVTQAIVTLKDFYRGESFIQQPEFGSSRSDAGNGIIEILEVASQDFASLLAESEATEAAAQEAFDTMKQDNAVAKATKEADVKGKESEIKSLNASLSNTKQDLEQTNNELDAIMDYIEKLKPQCENKAMSYAERKSRRDSEISGLKDALQTLAKDEGSFIQEKGFLQ